MNVIIRIDDSELGGEIIKSSIKCVSAKVVHDNEGRLALEYHGEGFLRINCTCMTIPLRVTKDDGITIRYKEKEMTKAEIEKLLGYKIKIIG